MEASKKQKEDEKLKLLKELMIDKNAYLDDDFKDEGFLKDFIKNALSAKYYKEKQENMDEDQPGTSDSTIPECPFHPHISCSADCENVLNVRGKRKSEIDDDLKILRKHIKMRKKALKTMHEEGIEAEESSSASSDFELESEIAQPQKFLSSAQFKLLKKCHLKSEYNPNTEEISLMIHKICSHDLLNKCVEVVAFYDPIVFDFDNDPSNPYFKTHPDFGEDFIYVTINCRKEERISFFVYEIAKNALKIIFQDQTLLLRENGNAMEVYKNLMSLKNDDVIKKLMSGDETVEFFELIAGHCFNMFRDDSKEIKASDEGGRIHMLMNIYLFHPDFNLVRSLNRKFCLFKNLKNSDIKLKTLALETKVLKHDREYDDILLIETNIPQAVLHSIHHKIVEKEIAPDSHNLFVDSNLLNLESIKKNLAQVDSTRRIIVDASKCDEMLMKTLGKIETSFLIIVATKIDHRIMDHITDKFTKISKNYSWSHLSAETQEYLLEKKIKFQNRSVEFGDVFTSNFENLPSNILQTLCSDEQLVINSLETFIDVPRNFRIEEKGFHHFEEKDSHQKILYYSKSNVQNLLEKVRNEKAILLTGSKSSGKSNALKAICKNLSRRDTFVKYFRSCFEFDKTLKDYVLAHIYNDNDKFTFEEFYKKGKAIIFIDDVENFELLWKILDGNIKEYENQVWISTTDSIADSIESNFNVTRVKLATVTDSDKTEFIENFSENHENSIVNICEKFLNKNECLYAYDRKLYQAHALRVYFTDEQSICGMSLIDIPTPHVHKPLPQIIKIFSNGNVSFSSMIWVDYFVASFIKDSFLVCRGSLKELMHLFLKVIKDDTFRNARTILNDMNHLTILKNNKKEYANELANELQNQSFRVFENIDELFEVHNLSKFIIKLLNNADINDLIYEKIVVNILNDTVPSNMNFRCNKIQSVKKLIQIVTEREDSKKVFDSGEMFRCLAEKSSDDTLIKWILNDFGIKISSIQKGVLCEIAITNGNEKLLSLLLSLKSMHFDVWETLMERSFYTENYNLYTIVKMYGNDKFSFNSKSVISRYEKILKDITNFHEYIKADNVIEIEELARKNPRLKYWKGRERVDALQLANKFGRFETFRLLLEKNFKSENQIDMADFFIFYLFNNIGKCEKADDSYISLLCSKHMSFNKTTEINQLNICKAIKELSQYPYLEDVFKTVASSDEVQIICTSDENVKSFDATQSEYTKAMYYPGLKTILIPTIKDKKNLHENIAHEFSHCAFDLTYKNGCTPYPKDDKNRQQEWQDIVNNYQRNKKYLNEPIIQNVFLVYGEQEQEAELAVRAMHLIANRYTDDENSNVNDSGCEENSNSIVTLQQLKLDFPELYDYHEKYGVKDFRIVDGSPLRQLNESFGLLNIISKYDVSFNENKYLKQQVFEDYSKVRIFTKSPELFLKNVYDILLNISSGTSLLVESENIFVDLNLFSINESLALKLSQLSHSKTLKRVIILCHYQKISPKLILLLGKLRQHLVLVNPGCGFNKIRSTDVEIFYNWNNHSHESFTIDPTEKSRNNILNKKVEFHSHQIKLKDIIREEHIDEECLNAICQSDKLLINPGESFETFETRKVLIATEDKSSRKFSQISIKNLAANSGKYVLISDTYSSGKSDALKNIYKTLVKDDENRDYWINFIPLKRYKHILKNDSKDIRYELANATTVLERKVFDHYWNNQKVIFLIDEIDELEIEMRAKALNIVRDNPTNFHKVFITCRINIEQNLCSYFKNKIETIITLCSFDDKAKLGIIKHYNYPENFLTRLLESSKKLLSIPFLFIVTKLRHEIWDLIHGSFPNLSLYQSYQIYFDSTFKELQRNFQMSQNDFDIINDRAFKNFKRDFEEIFCLFQSHYEVNAVERSHLVDPSKMIFINEVHGIYWMANTFIKIFLRPSNNSSLNVKILRILWNMLDAHEENRTFLQLFDGGLKALNDPFKTYNEIRYPQYKVRELYGVMTMSNDFKEKYPNISKFFEGIRVYNDFISLTDEIRQENIIFSQ